MHRGYRGHRGHRGKRVQNSPLSRSAGTAHGAPPQPHVPSSHPRHVRVRGPRKPARRARPDGSDFPATRPPIRRSRGPSCGTPSARATDGPVSGHRFRWGTRRVAHRQRASRGRFRGSRRAAGQSFGHEAWRRGPRHSTRETGVRVRHCRWADMWHSSVLHVIGGVEVSEETEQKSGNKRPTAAVFVDTAKETQKKISTVAGGGGFRVYENLNLQILPQQYPVPFLKKEQTKYKGLAKVAHEKQWTVAVISRRTFLGTLVCTPSTATGTLRRWAPPRALREAAERTRPDLQNGRQPQ